MERLPARTDDQRQPVIGTDSSTDSAIQHMVDIKYDLDKTPTMKLHNR
jgi:hypothetical protein